MQHQQRTLLWYHNGFIQGQSLSQQSNQDGLLVMPQTGCNLWRPLRRTIRVQHLQTYAVGSTHTEADYVHTLEQDFWGKKKKKIYI